MQRSVQREGNGKIAGEMQLAHDAYQQAKAGQQQKMSWVEKSLGIHRGVREMPPQIRTLPVKMSHHSFQSPIKLNQGYLKVAGLLCSKKKWPTQANAYPCTNATAMRHHICVATAAESSATAILVLAKCICRQVRLACSPI